MPEHEEIVNDFFPHLRPSMKNMCSFRKHTDDKAARSVDAEGHTKDYIVRLTFNMMEKTAKTMFIQNCRVSTMRTVRLYAVCSTYAHMPYERPNIIVNYKTRR